MPFESGYHIEIRPELLTADEMSDSAGVKAAKTS
jgi:hypothetical protein